MTRASVFRRSKLLLLAAALVALAVLMVSDARPASADHTIPTPVLTPVPGLDSVTITWEHPMPNVRLRAAFLWKEAESSTWQTGTPFFDLPADALSLSRTITDLKTGTTYDFALHISDSYGEVHLDAERAYVQVTIGAPHAPVISVQPLNQVVDLDVTWNEPEDNGDTITGYDVQYKRSNAETWMDEGVSFPHGHTRRAWIGDLDVGVAYDVRARASNSRGAGPWSTIATGMPVGPPAPAYRGADSAVGFASATYSGTEGDAITIELRLSLAQPEPVRFQVRPEYGSAADYWSDYSLGACSSGEDSCDFGAGILDVEIPAGEFSYSYDIRTEDDHRVEGDETFTLTVFPLSSNSETGDTSQTAITITDNDEAGVVVSEEGITVDEDTSGSYTVKLTSQPDGYVAIYAESAFPCKVNVSPGFVELGPSNWNQPQTFAHVRAWHDYDAADEEVVISHRIEAGSRDAEYADVEVDSVTVNVTDKHLPGVIVETATVETGVGGTARYRVYLNADPSPVYGERPAGCYDYTESHTVTIEATSSDTNIATVSPASVTFTADDYDPKHFTVTGVSAGDVAITHAVSGTDPDYTDGTIIVQSTAVTVPALQQGPAEPPSMPQGATTEGVVSPLPGPVLEMELAAAADGLTVSWSAPETGDAPTRYIVHIKPVGGGKGATKTPKPGKTSVTFRGVEEGQTYKVFVRAVNEAGKGPRTYAIITLPELRPD